MVWERHSGWPVALALTAALALVGVYGCGSGGEESLPAGTLTKRQFLEKATVICTQGTNEAQKADEAAWDRYQPDHITENEAILNKISLALVPAREKALRRLRAIGLPKGGEAQVDEILTAAEEGFEEGREEPRLLREGTKEFGLTRADEMGSKYGLEGCW
jgi:hypothetical protein